MVPVRRSMTHMPDVMFADVDPAVPRSCARHRREGWRRLGNGLLPGWKRRRRFRIRLLRRRALIGRGLLRGRR
jgi:hypothetical protein